MKMTLTTKYNQKLIIFNESVYALLRMASSLKAKSIIID